MENVEIVETVYGRHNKFEVVKESSLFGSTRYYVRKDGKPHRGSFSSLRAAMEAAEADAGR